MVYINKEDFNKDVVDSYLTQYPITILKILMITIIEIKMKIWRCGTITHRC